MVTRARKEYTWHDKWGIERNGQGFIQLVATNISQKERRRVGKLLVAALNGELVDPSTINDFPLPQPPTEIVELSIQRPGGVAALAAEVTGKNYKKKRSK